MEFSRDASVLMQRAGKRTAALQVVAVALLCIVSFLYIDLSGREKELNDGVHENTMWAVYQLDREVRNIEQMADKIVGGMLEDDHEANLALRLDILYSRIDLLDKPGYVAFFSDQAEIGKRKSELVDQFNRLEPDLLRLARGDRDEVLLEDTHEELETLEELSNQLLLTANNISTATRTDKRNKLQSVQNLTAIFVGFLLLSIVLLIATLRRQLNSVRAAGMSMEAMARQLSEAYSAADAGNRAKSQFMATMGHEIRTPLNAILGTAELMEYSDIPKPVRDNVKVIRSSGEALLEVLNEILDYSKIEHGKLELEERPVNVEQLVDSVSSIMGGRATESGNSIVLDIPEKLEWPWVKTDPTRVRQILLNLTSNAIKFTENGTITLKVRERSGLNTGKFLRFEVKDSGIGIDEEGQKRLFKPFSQVDASISRRFGGTGLGLTICKEIAERLNGQMGVSSSVGKGSTFWFEIPVEIAEAGDDELQLKQMQSLSCLTPLRIMLVEDNKVNQQVAMRFLQRLGQDADIAANGLEAVKLAAEAKYDLILMDMQMPEMDGITATHAIRGQAGPNQATSIIAMTANASDEDRRACQDAGMNGFETKPMSLARLRALLIGAGARSIDDVDEQKADGSSDQSADTSGGLDAARRDELVEALGEDIFSELLDSFFNDSVGLLSDLRAALAENDSDAADHALHTIKGAAANVGFRDISEIAENMRSALADTDALDRLETTINQEKAALAA